MPKRMIVIATLLASTAATPCLAEDAKGTGSENDAATAQSAAAPEPDKPTTGKAFTTGVAKGRDLLDTAISASVIDEQDLTKLSVSSIAGILQNIPGIRSETSDIDGYSAITIRGLPLSAEGSKFLQLQEDGLPVLEFGDIQYAGIDQFLRIDLTLTQVQAIRGGSASTFASNSPGGIINFISRTGETEGGLLQVSSGVGHDLKRIDFAYGAPLGDGWRFHAGGFYREGEGPREIGFNGFQGGQIKANLTKTFEGGYIRFYGKYLNDRQPNHGLLPATIGGTNADPEIGFLPGYDIREQAFLTPLIASYGEVDRNNNRTVIDARDGLAAMVKSVGLEAQFEIGEWNISNRFRFSDVSGEYNDAFPFVTLPAPVIADFGGPGSQLIFAAGPNAGQTISDARLLSLTIRSQAEIVGLDNATNDLRASRVWEVGNGKLTTTFGVYNSRQDIKLAFNFTSTLDDLAGGGRSAPVNLTTANGVSLTDNGTLAYGFAVAFPLSIYHDFYDAEYDVLAPYGSVNYQIGKFAIGASIRWDRGSVNGSVFSSDYGDGRVTAVPFDINGDGQISAAESRVPTLPLNQPVIADYDYDYLSYSGGINYRASGPFSAFARYSRGGRASAETVLRPGTLNPRTGELTDPAVAVSIVKQAEVGVKFRRNGLTAYLTGFWASTGERNIQVAADASGTPVVLSVNRTYSARGLEFEGDWRKGPFAVVVGATYTNATIDNDEFSPAFNGNTPRHIPDFAFFARPEFDLGKVTLGAVVNGSTKSFAQDTNELVQPGYVLVSPFVQYRPTERLTVAVNAFNVFNDIAVVQIQAASLPPSGIANVQVMNGRTVTASLRYAF